MCFYSLYYKLAVFIVFIIKLNNYIFEKKAVNIDICYSQVQYSHNGRVHGVAGARGDMTGDNDSHHENTESWEP